MDVAARLEAVDQENDRLRERIAMLEAALFGKAGPPIQLRLTASEGRVFGMLMARQECSKDALMAALYRDGARDEAAPKIVDVFVCKMRKKFEPFGITIETLWGRGYAMPQASKAIARSMMPQGEPDDGVAA